MLQLHLFSLKKGLTIDIIQQIEENLSKAETFDSDARLFGAEEKIELIKNNFAT